jgi:ammonia channel protein AmtB
VGAVRLQLAFTEGNAFIGGTDRIVRRRALNASSIGATFTKGVYIPELAFFVFQGAFACITCALIVGAFAERVKFAGVLLFTVLWFTFAYLPMAHMVWFFPGPDAFTDRARWMACWPSRAICGPRARWISPAARWCTSMPRSPVWSAPT